jgi:ribosomal 30S subunit maturation factor RimM
MLDEYLVIGEILKPQGVKGEVKVRPITCDPSRLDRPHPRVLSDESGRLRAAKDPGQPRRFRRGLPDGPRAVADRTAAEGLRAA